MMDILTGDVPDYRYGFSFESLVVEKEDVENLKKFCFKQAVADYKSGKKTRAYRIAKGLIKVSWMKADELIGEFKKMKEEEKKKAVGLLKEKKYYEAYRIYNSLSEIFSEEEAPGVYAFKKKLTEAPKSSLDIKQAETFLKIYKNSRNRSYSKNKLREDCRKFLTDWPKSRFAEKVKALQK